MAILTEPATDAAGGHRESFVDVARYYPDAQSFTISKIIPKRFLVRLIKIQRRSQASSDLFADLFGDMSNGSDFAARIVSISPPVGAS
jgi:hypothetical protein